MRRGLHLEHGGRANLITCLLSDLLGHLFQLSDLIKNISVPTGEDRVIMEERLWPLTVKFSPKSALSRNG